MKFLMPLVLFANFSIANAAEPAKKTAPEERKPAAARVTGQVAFSDGAKVEMVSLSEGLAIIQITRVGGRQCYAIKNSEGNSDAGVAAHIVCQD